MNLIMKDKVSIEYQNYSNRRSKSKKAQVLQQIGLAVFLITVISNYLSAQSSHELLMEGDNLFNKEQYDLAEEKYRKASETDKQNGDRMILAFHNVLYKDKSYKNVVKTPE